MKGLFLLSLVSTCLCMQPNFNRLRRYTKQEVRHGLGTEIQNINGIIIRNYNDKGYWRYALESIIPLNKYYLRISTDVSMSHLKNVAGPVILLELIRLTNKMIIFYEYEKISSLDYLISLSSIINVRHILRNAGD